MSSFNITYFITRLADNATTIQNLLSGIPSEQTRWRPSDEAWSLLEVINHLYDEEREDFRTRVDIMLHRPGDTWPPIHPGSWVTERHYNSRDWAQSLAAWQTERAQSLVWLRGLQSPKWENAAQSPWGDEMQAGDLLASWLAHDYHHLRQIVELHFAYTKMVAQPFEVEYAGDW